MSENALPRSSIRPDRALVYRSDQLIALALLGLRQGKSPAQIRDEFDIHECQRAEWDRTLSRISRSVDL